MTGVRPWCRAFLDALYPRSCRVCEAPLAAEREPASLREWLCETCIDELPQVEPPFCSVCGEPYDGAISGAFRCQNCADRKFAFEFAVAGYRADGPARELIHRFKYGRDLSLRGLLGRMLLRSLEDPRLAAEPLADWLLVPVPLFRTREGDREFNQSRELCHTLAGLTGMAVLDCLKRIRNTGSQASMNREQRLKNLRGAFSVRRWFGGAARAKGAAILLVDDVFTTGATTHECARTLKKEGGAEKIVVITVARG